MDPEAPLPANHSDRDSTPADTVGLRPGRLFSLDGRVAIVTGGAGGIGRVLARGLMAAGADIVISDRDGTALAEVARALAPIGTVVTHAADVTQPDAREALVDTAIERLGRVDVLVNAAAINHRQPVDEVEPATFQRLLAVDLEAPYFLAQLAARAIRRHDEGGSIVHVGSINSAIGLPGVSVYAAAKAALSQLARGMAVEWASEGIRVNCLAPGFTRTPLIEPILADPVRAGWIRTNTPMRRVAEPSELVGACLLLASDAGSFITGQTLFVDGGLLSGGSWTEPAAGT